MENKNKNKNKNKRKDIINKDLTERSKNINENERLSDNMEINLKQRIGNNKTFLKGKIIVGNHYYHIIYSILLLSIPTIIYIITLFNLQKKIIPITFTIIILLTLIILIIFLIKGGTTDPGIIERNNEFIFYDNRKSVIKINKNGHIIDLNYCYTCFHFRPPRTSHCAECEKKKKKFYNFFFQHKFPSKDNDDQIFQHNYHIMHNDWFLEDENENKYNNNLNL